jgi:hypothetical protein
METCHSATKFSPEDRHEVQTVTVTGHLDYCVGRSIARVAKASTQLPILHGEAKAGQVVRSVLPPAYDISCMHSTVSPATKLG